MANRTKKMISMIYMWKSQKFTRWKLYKLDLELYDICNWDFPLEFHMNYAVSIYIYLEERNISFQFWKEKTLLLLVNVISSKDYVHRHYRMLSLWMATAFSGAALAFNPTPHPQVGWRWTRHIEEMKFSGPFNLAGQYFPWRGVSSLRW